MVSRWPFGQNGLIPNWILAFAGPKMDQLVHFGPLRGPLLGCQQPSSPNVKPSATSNREFGHKLLHHVMPKVFVLKARDIMRCDEFWHFFGQIGRKRSHSCDGCFLLKFGLLNPSTPLREGRGPSATQPVRVRQRGVGHSQVLLPLWFCKYDLVPLLI